ncbi:MAG: transposase [Acidimicrobiales bacterium]
MSKPSPSVLLQEELHRLLWRGTPGREDIIAVLANTVTRLVVQALLEAEQTDYLLGRGRYERRGDQSGSRNGYIRGRLRTAAGSIELRVPQVRGTGVTYRSSLMSFFGRNSQDLEPLVTELHVRGICGRDLGSELKEDAFRDATGVRLISRAAVSQVIHTLWREYQSFIAQDLSALKVQSLFCAEAFGRLPRRDSEEVPLVAWCCDVQGRKYLLHLAVGRKESEAVWAKFFRNVVARGLHLPRTIATRGTPEMIQAVDAVLVSPFRIDS